MDSKGQREQQGQWGQRGQWGTVRTAGDSGDNGDSGGQQGTAETTGTVGTTGDSEGQRGTAGDGRDSGDSGGQQGQRGQRGTAGTAGTAGTGRISELYCMLDAGKALRDRVHGQAHCHPHSGSRGAKQRGKVTCKGRAPRAELGLGPRPGAAAQSPGRSFRPSLGSAGSECRASW